MDDVRMYFVKLVLVMDFYLYNDLDRRSGLVDWSGGDEVWCV